VASSGAFKHIRNYASAGTLASLAGVVTFPLLTRNLTIADYGVLGLITSSLTLFIAVGKLGMQHAVIRFYSQIKHANISFTTGQMNSTVSLLFFMFASITALIWLAFGLGVMPNFSNYWNLSKLFLVASGIVFLRLLSSGVTNFLRAQQRSAAVGVAQIIAKYGYLGFILLFMFLGKLSVGFVLLCMMLSEAVSLLYVSRKLWPDFSFKWSEVSASLGKAMLLYGMPLMIVESLGLVLRLSDRYIIQGLLGANDLGMYSASYNLTAYLDIIFLAAMAQAIKPYYMQLWEGESAEKTRVFLKKGFHVYWVVGIPFIALFSLVAPHLLNFLASPKYAPGTIIIPFVAFSFLLEGSIHFLSAGLYIQKNTKVLMFWGSVAAIVNLVLNFVFIPTYGILGAAIVTIISYAVFMVAISYHSFKFISFQIQPRIPLLIMLLSLIVYALLFKLDFGGEFANIMGKGTLGTLLLLAVILLTDNQSREWFVERLRTPKPGVAK